MKSSRAAIATISVALLLVGATSTSASAKVSSTKAKDSVPQGAALVRIEGPAAKVTSRGAGKYTLSLRDPEQIRWLGEVAKLNGKKVLSSGVRPASAIVTDWRELLLDKQPTATATLTWNTGSSQPGYALVELQKPKYSKQGGITAKFTSSDSIPARLADVSLNLHRADGKVTRAFPSVSNFEVTATMDFQTTQPEATVAQVSILCGPIMAYRLTLMSQATQVKLPYDVNCGPESGEILAGSTFTMNPPSAVQNGNVVFAGLILPPNEGPIDSNLVIAQLYSN